MALATFYDVSLDWIATGQGDPKGTATAQNANEALLLYAFRNLSEDVAVSHLDLMLKQAGTRKN